MPKAQRTLVTDWNLFCPLISPPSPAHSNPGKTRDSAVGVKVKQLKKKKEEK